MILSFNGDVGLDSVAQEIGELLSIGVSFDTMPEIRWDSDEPEIDPSWLSLPAPNSQRQSVLLAVLEGDKTRDDLDRELGIGSVGPRLRELRLGGFVEYSDRTKITQYGSQGRVLAATHKTKTQCRLKPAAWFPGGVRPETCR
jgi:hypothetical protein